MLCVWARGTLVNFRSRLFFWREREAEESFTLASILDSKSPQSLRRPFSHIHTITRQICDKKSNHDLNICCQGLYSHIDVVEQRARLSGDRVDTAQALAAPRTRTHARPRRTATPKKAGRAVGSSGDERCAIEGSLSHPQGRLVERTLKGEQTH